MKNLAEDQAKILILDCMKSCFYKNEYNGFIFI